MTRWIRFAVVAALPALAAACDDLGRALTAHARAAAEAGGIRLAPEELGRIMAGSAIPDTALNGYWAAQIATLWSDYVRLADVYVSPDSTRTIDFEPLLEGQRYYDALAVARYRDSVVLRGLEPSEEEMRRFFDERQPFTRLDVRRIRLSVPEGAPEATRDSLYGVAGRARAGLAAGEDFVQAARRLSDEPLAARGQLLAYQGHESFPPAGDSVVYRLAPGEVSPPISTGEEILLYRLERRVVPEYDQARDRVRKLMVEERSERAALLAQDTLIGNARPAILDGAVPTARRIASDPAMAAGRIPPGSRLVAFRDGEITASDLRLLFQVRGDIRELFGQASDEELEGYLYELARDEILAAAARRHGLAPTEAERRSLHDALAAQVAAVGRQLGLSHNLVTSPRYDREAEALAFLERTVRRGRALPWLGEMRVVLDRGYPARVDERGAEAAAAAALRARAREAAAARGSGEAGGNATAAGGAGEAGGEAGR